MPTVTLHLKKGEETKTLELNLMKPKSARLIKRVMREKWELVDCEGDNPSIVAYIKKQITTYEANRETYRANPMEAVKLGKSVVNLKGKIHLSKRHLIMAKFRAKEGLNEDKKN
jgi:hypothetical protein